MRLTIPFDLSVASQFDYRKVEIQRLLSTKKYKQYFYRVNEMGSIPLTGFEKFILKLKTVWNILFGKIDAAVGYSHYLNETMRKTHMKSLLEKQVKLKCLGIVTDEEPIGIQAHDMMNPIVKSKMEEITKYNDEISDYLKDDPQFKDLQEKDLNARIDMMKLYIESNDITEKSSDADKYITLVSTLNVRDEI